MTEFSDDFNRPDGPPGPNWIPHSTGSSFQTIVNNELVGPTNPGAFEIVTWVTPMPGNDHRVGFAVGSIVPYAVFMHLRGSDNNQVLALVYGSGRIRIFTEIGHSVIEFGGDEQANVPAVLGTPLATGQKVSFEAAGSDYTVRVNGAARLTWPDTTGIYTPYVDADHRFVSIGPYSPTSPGAVDNFFAGDIPVPVSVAIPKVHPRDWTVFDPNLRIEEHSNETMHTVVVTYLPTGQQQSCGKYGHQAQNRTAAIEQLRLRVGQ